MANNIKASIELDIAPFLDKLNEAINETKGTAQKVSDAFKDSKISLDLNNVTKQIENFDPAINIKTVIDDSQLKVINDLQNSPSIDIKINTDSTEIDTADSKIENLKKKRTKVKVETDNSDIDKTQSELNKLDSASPNVKIKTDDTELKNSKKIADKLDAETVTVKVKADSKGLEGVKDKLKEITDGFSGGMGGGLMDAFASGGAIGAGMALATGAFEAFTGAVTEAIGAGFELNNALKDLENLSKTTGANFSALKKGAEDAFILGVGGSVAEATQIIGKMQQQLGTVFTGDEIGQFAAQAQAVGKVLDVDVTEVVTKATPLIKQFGLTGAEAFDLLALSATKGTSAQNDILDSLSEYSQLAKLAGASAFQFGELLTRGSAAGVFNTDKIADSLKEAQIRINAGDFKQAFSDLATGSSGAEKETSKNIRKIIQASQDGKLTVIEGLQQSSALIAKGLESGKISQSFASKLQIAIAGTPAEDLGVDVYNRIFSAPLDEKAIRENAKKAGTALSATLGQYTSFEAVSKQFELFITKLTAGAVNFADKVLSPLIGGVIEIFKSVGNEFNKVFSGGKAASELQSYIDKLIAGFSFVIEIIKGSVAPIFTMLFNVINVVVSNVYGVINDVIDAFSSLTGAGGGFIDSFKRYSELLSKFYEVVSSVIGIILQLVRIAITPLISAIGAITDITVNILKYFGNLLGITGGLGDAFSSLDNFLNAVKGTLGGVSAALDVIGTSLGNFIRAMLSFNIKDALAAFSGFGDKISTEYKKGFQEATKSGKSNADELNKIHKETFEQMSANIDALGKKKLSAIDLEKAKKEFRSLAEENVKSDKLVLEDKNKLFIRLDNLIAKDLDKNKNALITKKEQYENFAIDTSQIIEDAISGAYSNMKFNDDAVIKNAETTITNLSGVFDKLSFEDTETGKLKDKFEEISKKLPQIVIDAKLNPGDFKDAKSSMDVMLILQKKYNEQADIINAKIKEGLNAKQLSEVNAETKKWIETLQQKLNIGNLQEYNKQIVDTNNAIKDLQAEKSNNPTAQRLSEIGIELDKLQKVKKNLNLDVVVDYNKTVLDINAEISKRNNELVKLQLKPELNADAIKQTESDIAKLNDTLAQKTIQISQFTLYGVTNNLEEISNAYDLTKKNIFEKKTDEKNSIFTAELEKIKEQADKIPPMLRKIEAAVPKSAFDDLAKAFVEGAKAFDPSAIIQANKDIETSINEVKDTQKTQMDDLNGQLATGVIAYSDYTDKLSELDQERLDKEQEINDKRLSMWDFVNGSLIAGFENMQKAASDSLTKLGQKYADAGKGFADVTEFMNAAITNSLVLLGSGLGKSLAEGKNFFASLLAETIKTAQVLLNAWAAPLLLKMMTEQPFGIGVIGWSAALITANALLTLASASLGAEQGHNPSKGTNYGKRGKTDTKQVWVDPMEPIIPVDIGKRESNVIDYWFNGKTTNDFFYDNYGKHIEKIVNSKMNEFTGSQQIYVNNLLDEKFQKSLNSHITNLNTKIVIPENISTNNYEKRLERIENNVRTIQVVETTKNVAVEHSFGKTILRGNDLEMSVERSKRSKLRRF